MKKTIIVLIQERIKEMKEMQVHDSKKKKVLFLAFASFIDAVANNDTPSEEYCDCIIAMLNLVEKEISFQNEPKPVYSSPFQAIEDSEGALDKSDVVAFFAYNIILKTPNKYDVFIFLHMAKELGVDTATENKLILEKLQ